MSEHPRPDAASAEARLARLSDGQRECLRLVAAHHSSKEIAAKLDISPHTVDQRIRLSLQILGVARRQEAARLLAEHEARPGENPYQRLIRQSPHIPEPSRSVQSGAAIDKQIRHVDRAGSSGAALSNTEQDGARLRFSLPLPFATRHRPRNEMGIGMRLLWIVLIAMGSIFAAGMYMAGLESLARLLSG